LRAPRPPTRPRRLGCRSGPERSGAGTADVELRRATLTRERPSQSISTQYTLPVGGPVYRAPTRSAKKSSMEIWNQSLLLTFSDVKGMSHLTVPEPGTGGENEI